MKTTALEVKTIYSIELEKKDVKKAFEKARDDFNNLGKETFECLYKEAFASLLNKNYEELLQREVEGYVDRIINHLMGTKEDAETLRYIVKEYLKFDAIENFGSKHDEVRRMSVSNNGSHI